MDGLGLDRRSPDSGRSSTNPVISSEPLQVSGRRSEVGGLSHTFGLARRLLAHVNTRSQLVAPESLDGRCPLLQYVRASASTSGVLRKM